MQLPVQVLVRPCFWSSSIESYCLSGRATIRQASEEFAFGGFLPEAKDSKLLGDGGHGVHMSRGGEDFDKLEWQASPNIQAFRGAWKET
jgi:hypothetical protein